MRNFRVGKIKEAVNIRRNLKSERKKLGVRKGKMCAGKDKQGNFPSNFGDIVKAAEESCADFYSTESRRATFIRITDELNTKTPSITRDGVRKRGRRK